MRRCRGAFLESRDAPCSFFIPGRHTYIVLRKFLGWPGRRSTGKAQISGEESSKRLNELMSRRSDRMDGLGDKTLSGAAVGLFGGMTLSSISPGTVNDFSDVLRQLSITGISTAGGAAGGAYVGLGQKFRKNSEAIIAATERLGKALSQDYSPEKTKRSNGLWIRTNTSTLIFQAGLSARKSRRRPSCTASGSRPRR